MEAYRGSGANSGYHAEPAGTSSSGNASASSYTNTLALPDPQPSAAAATPGASSGRAERSVRTPETLSFAEADKRVDAAMAQPDPAGDQPKTSAASDPARGADTFSDADMAEYDLQRKADDADFDQLLAQSLANAQPSTPPASSPPPPPTAPDGKAGYYYKYYDVADVGPDEAPPAASPNPATPGAPAAAASTAASPGNGRAASYTDSLPLTDTADQPGGGSGYTDALGITPNEPAPAPAANQMGKLDQRIAEAASAGSTAKFTALKPVVAGIRAGLAKGVEAATQMKSLVGTIMQAEAGRRENQNPTVASYDEVARLATSLAEYAQAQAAALDEVDANPNVPAFQKKAVQTGKTQWEQAAAVFQAYVGHDRQSPLPALAELYVTPPNSASLKAAKIKPVTLDPAMVKMAANLATAETTSETHGTALDAHSGASAQASEELLAVDTNGIAALEAFKANAPVQIASEAVDLSPLDDYLSSVEQQVMAAVSAWAQKRTGPAPTTFQPGMVLTQSYGRDFVQVMARAQGGGWSVSRWTSPFEEKYIYDLDMDESELLKMRVLKA